MNKFLLLNKTYGAYRDDSRYGNAKYDNLEKAYIHNKVSLDYVFYQFRLFDSESSKNLKVIEFKQ